MFSGAKLFELKATRGLPIDFALDRIREKGLTVDWIGFFDAARRNGWWDFQTHQVIQHGIDDAGLPEQERESIVAAFKRYVLTNPHPALARQN